MPMRQIPPHSVPIRKVRSLKSVRSIAGALETRTSASDLARYPHVSVVVTANPVIYLTGDERTPGSTVDL